MVLNYSLEEMGVAGSEERRIGDAEDRCCMMRDAEASLNVEGQVLSH